MKTPNDPFFSAYLEAAFWTEEDRDESGDSPGLSNLSPEAFDKAKSDCSRFGSENKATLSAAYESDGYHYGQAGHDFWLTRNHHGSGFWDRDLPDAIGKALTAAAHAFGETDLYRGDDAQFYFSR